MAKKQEKKKGKVIAKFDISDNAKLVFTTDGETYVDIRTHIDIEGYSGPTKKGIRFSTDRFDAFRKAIRKMRKELGGE